MKIIFIIQAEGRGHTMQAIAMKEMIERHGHTVSRVFKGYGFFKTDARPENEMGISATCFLSPFFISSADNKGINLWKTFLVNIILIPVYIFEIVRLGITIRIQRPDMVVNFYDMTGGLALLLTGRHIRKYVISHHFFLEHPDFRWPAKRRYEKLLLLAHSFLTSLSAWKKLALSFTPAENIPNKNLFIMPPILREKILLAQTGDDGHIHIYTLRTGYYKEVIRFCIENPDVQVHFFSDFTTLPLTNLPNLEFFKFDEEKFIDSLVSCSHVISTAGFETLAEAAYLGKPIGVIPSERHYEQYCNAMDLERSGLGIRAENLSDLIELKGSPYRMNHDFREWVCKAEKLLSEYLELS